MKSVSLKRSLLTSITIAILIFSMVMIPNSVEATSNEDRVTAWFPEPGSTFPPDGEKSDIQSNSSIEITVNFEDEDFDLQNDISFSAHVYGIGNIGGKYVARILVTAYSASEWDYDYNYGSDEVETGGLSLISLSTEQTSTDTDCRMRWLEDFNKGNNLTDEADEYDREEEIVKRQIGVADSWGDAMVADFTGEGLKVPLATETTKKAGYEFLDPVIYNNDGVSTGRGDETTEIIFDAKDRIEDKNPEGDKYGWTDDKSHAMASSLLEWEIPYDNRDEDHTLTVTARNVMKYFDSRGPDSIEREGAEATVEIHVQGDDI